MKLNTIKWFAVCAAVAAFAAFGGEEDGRNIAPLVQGAVQARPDAVKRWRDLRFGRFVHRGPVSLTVKEIGWSRGRETPVEE